MTTKTGPKAPKIQYQDITTAPHTASRKNAESPVRTTQKRSSSTPTSRNGTTLQTFAPPQAHTAPRSTTTTKMNNPSITETKEHYDAPSISASQSSVPKIQNTATSDKGDDQPDVIEPEPTQIALQHLGNDIVSLIISEYLELSDIKSLISANKASFRYIATLPIQQTIVFTNDKVKRLFELLCGKSTKRPQLTYCYYTNTVTSPTWNPQLIKKFSTSPIPTHCSRP